jgi:demethylmenaquinone methyltransferase/2-methoxy-6-polyprenyl-1,4-benzoquinol methylase
MTNQENQDKNIKPLLKMFNEVPGRYDLMNRLLTFRLDEIWRKRAVRLCLEKNPAKILDICTGTGDLAIRLARESGPDAKITALDFSEPMLSFAKKKFLKRKLHQIQLVHADVAELPFPDQTFDAIGIGFAFRNLTFNNVKRDLYLPEILRVLKKGGRFVIIETSQPSYKWIRYLAHAYFRIVVRFAGGFLSGNKGAYRYLAHSAIHYHTREDVEALLLKTGFAEVASYPQLFGVAAIHVAIR